MQTNARSTCNKQGIRTACLLKQVNIIGALKVGASRRATRTADITGGDTEAEK